MTVAHGDSVRPSALGRGAGVHEDILRGTDAEISWEDVFVGMFCGSRELRLGRTRRVKQARR